MDSRVYQPIRIFERDGRPHGELNRGRFLAELARGQSGFHVGCADYPMAEQRLASGTLLQAALAENSRSLLGIDLSSEGLDLLARHGFEPLRVMDAESIDLDGKLEFVVAGDVLEHMNKPGEFLERVPSLLQPGGSIVIGVPNALSLDVFRFALSGVERTHRDHTFYYSPKTLTELCARVGLLPTRLVFTVQPKEEHDSALFILLRDPLVKSVPRLAPGFLMEIRLPDFVDESYFYLWK